MEVAGIIPERRETPDRHCALAQQRTNWGYGLAAWLATGGGIGYAPIAPGTFGTLLGIPLHLVLARLSPGAYAAAVLVLFLAGVWLCSVAEARLGQRDHPAIVWDEIVGYQITVWLAPGGWFWIAVGFALFRLFDVWKPFPIRRIEHLPRGLGAMTDDALAGVYAFAVLQAAAWLAAAR